MANEALAWPSAPSSTDSTDGVSYVMGVAFSVAGTVSCTGSRWRVPDTLSAPDGGAYAFILFNETANLRIGYKEFVPVAGGDQDILWDTAISLSSGNTYVATVYTQHYVFTSGSPAGVTTPSGSATAIEGRLAQYSGGAATAPRPTGAVASTYYVSPLIDTGSSQTVSPTGLAITTALGTPAAVNAMDTVSPTGLNKTVALGTPTASQSFTLTPNGLAIPVALGTPAAVNAMDTITPAGLAIPEAVGTPTASQTLTTTPSGISAPVALGSPTVSMLAGTALPTALAIPVVLGTPTVSGQPYLQQLTGGSWWELESTLTASRAQKRFWDTVQPLACPNDGEPLRRSVDGILFCPYDNWRPDDQAPRKRAANLGRDWGDIRGIQQAAAMDAGINQMILSCPNDGEPLSIAANGQQFCRWDGWMPPT